MEHVLTRSFARPTRPRPPALGPRRRPIAPDVERALRAWAHEAPGGSTATGVDVWEWVSRDARDLPHVVIIVMTFRHGRQPVSIAKASERIVAADVHAALGAALTSST